MERFLIILGVTLAYIGLTIMISAGALLLAELIAGQLGWLR